jgi:hypothetical protein
MALRCCRGTLYWRARLYVVAFSIRLRRLYFVWLHHHLIDAVRDDRGDAMSRYSQATARSRAALNLEWRSFAASSASIIDLPMQYTAPGVQRAPDLDSGHAPEGVT